MQADFQKKSNEVKKKTDKKLILTDLPDITNGEDLNCLLEDSADPTSFEVRNNFFINFKVIMIDKILFLFCNRTSFHLSRKTHCMTFKDE